MNPEERFTIMGHMLQTVIMLEKLPLPPHMKRIPE